MTPWDVIAFLAQIPIWIGLLFRRIRLMLRGKSLKGKVAVVSGASSGLGRALCHALHRQGVTLVMASRNLSELEALKRELLESSCANKATSAPVLLKLDLNDPDSIESAAAEVGRLFDRVDVLINNAGVSHRASFQDTELHTYRTIFEVNFFGMVHLTKALLPMILSSGGGSIVNISSLQGLFALPHRSAYSASKHAVQAWSDSIRSELCVVAPERPVNVLCVSPGYINTNLSMNALRGDGSSYNVKDDTQSSGFTADHVAEQILQGIQLSEQELLIAPCLHKIPRYVRHLSPWLYFWIMKHRAVRNHQALMPESQKSR